MGDFIYKFTLRELKILAGVSGMIGYSNLRKDELIRKLEEHLYFFLDVKCPSCDYNVTPLWIDWAVDFYDLSKPFSYSKPCGCNCPNCGINYSFIF